MQIGIVGLAKVGKTSLFNTLTGQELDTGKFSVDTEAHVGTARIRDPRLEALRDLFDPRRYTPATVEYVDVPGIRKEESGPLLDLPRLREVDALVHVVRAFEDPEIIHSSGEVDPVRDVVDLDLELILADHSLMERRLDRLSQAVKRGLSEDEKREQALLEGVVLPALEAETPLRKLDLGAEQERRLRGFQLLSAKPMLVALNVDDASVGRPADALLPLASPEDEAPVVVISATIEEEISRLDESDQRELLDSLGLAEPSSERLIKASYELLGYVSFFTVGEDEVRAWTIRRGTKARDAAGKIHSDLQRGFIRAEVVPWDELIEAGSLSACRDRGRLRLEGKDYPVEDGEVMHVRFNV